MSRGRIKDILRNVREYMRTFYAKMRIFLGYRRVALASYPRSGNTWLRFMIEKITGEKSGSIYKDKIMERSDEGIVIKTHKKDYYRYTHAIHLVRNPFSVIISYYNYKKDISKVDELNWESHIKDTIVGWRNHTLYWLNANCKTKLIKYEDLHKHPLEVFKSILEWLGYYYSDEEINKVIEQSSIEKMRKLDSKLGSKFFRKGKVEYGIHHFSKEEIKTVIEELKDILDLLGYNKSIYMQYKGK